jgi:hypothetical protein
MATNKNFQDEEGKQKAAPKFAYWKCPGKWAENSYGEKHRICSGRLYTSDSPGIGSRCPVCGTDLIFIIADTPREDAVKCATGSCVGCKNREKSWAVANGCVGGYKYAGYKRVETYGTESCRACSCEKCCVRLRATVEDIGRMGMSEYMAARKAICLEVEEIIFQGKVKAENFQAFVASIKNGSGGKLSSLSVEWEVIEALRRMNFEH